MPQKKARINLINNIKNPRELVSLDNEAKILKQFIRSVLVNKILIEYQAIIGVNRQGSYIKETATSIHTFKFRSNPYVLKQELRISLT